MVKISLIFSAVIICVTRSINCLNETDLVRNKKDLNPVFRLEREINALVDTKILTKPGKVTGAYILKNILKHKVNVVAKSYPSTSAYSVSPTYLPAITVATPIQLTSNVEAVKYSPVRINALLQYQLPVKPIFEPVNYDKPSNEYIPAPTPTKYAPAPEPSYLPPMKAGSYEFSYDINVPERNLELGHSEKKELDEAQGTYYALLPDGRKQIVEYTAGKHGYRPVITYQPSLGYQLSGGYNYGGKKYPILNTEPDIDNNYQKSYESYDTYQMVKETSQDYHAEQSSNHIDNATPDEGLSLYLEQSRNSPYLSQPS